MHLPRRARRHRPCASPGRGMPLQQRSMQRWLRTGRRQRGASSKSCASWRAQKLAGRRTCDHDLGGAQVGALAVAQLLAHPLRLCAHAVLRLPARAGQPTA